MTVTKDTVMSAGFTACLSALENDIQKITLSQFDDVEDVVSDLLEDKYNYDAYTVDYYHEAWSIVTDSDFEPQETVDFSNCDNAMECVMAEARASIDDVVREGWNDAQKQVIELLKEIIEEAENMGNSDTLTITINSGCVFGWAVHNRETESGLCIYDDKAGYYYAHKLEGELYALEGDVNGTYFSLCWNPEKVGDDE